MQKINYNNESEREGIINDATSKGWILIKDARLLSGNYLEFDTNTELKLAQNTVETLELISALNELQKIEQAQSNAELIELMMMLGGM